jgi:DNA-binding LacI/PurR family transcriptional regulator
VLLVLPDVPLGPVVAHLIEQLTDELEPFGLSLVARRNRGDSRLSRLWRELRPIAVVGVVDLPSGAEEEMRAAGIAVVNTALSPKGDDATTAVPQHVVGRMQLEHLASRGHRRIAYAAPDDSRVNAFYALRLEGVRQACVELGMEQPDVREVHLTAEGGERAVRAWTAGKEPVTGVCAYNDETAFAVLAGARRLALRVPADIAVIGVDNIPLAALAAPPLTTVDQNIDGLTAHLAREVAHSVLGMPRPRPLLADALTLVVRESA